MPKKRVGELTSCINSLSSTLFCEARLCVTGFKMNLTVCDYVQYYQLYGLGIKRVDLEIVSQLALYVTTSVYVLKKYK